MDTHPRTPTQNSPLSARLGKRHSSSFTDELSLELGDGRNHLHGHLASGAGEVHSAQGQAMDPNLVGFEPLDGGAHIHSIASESVQFRYHQHIARLQTIDQTHEARTLA